MNGWMNVVVGGMQREGKIERQEGRMDGWMDGRMDGGMDRQIDRQIREFINIILRHCMSRRKEMNEQ